MIWNLNSELKSFLPRLGSEILTISFTSQKTNILALTLKENSIRFINLFDSSVLSDVSGISLNKYLPENHFENKSSIENFKKIKINKNKYLLIFNEDIGKIQLLNVKTGNITSNLNLIIKNFSSKTEKENINVRKLKFVELIKPSSDLLVTYEEIMINENYLGEILPENNNPSFLLSYLKLWKITDFSENNFTLELLSVAQNAHNTENIKGMCSSDLFLITYSDSIFKVWDFRNKDQLNNLFIGSYRKERINSVVLLKGGKIFSLHKNKYLIKWDILRKEIENVYSFGNRLLDKNRTTEYDVLMKSDEVNEISKKGISTEKLLLRTKKKLIIFNAETYDIEFENNFSDIEMFPQDSSERHEMSSEKRFIIEQKALFEILQADFQVSINNKNESKTHVRVIIRINKSVFMLIKFNISKAGFEINSFFFIKRMYLRYLDFLDFKSSEDLSLLMINTNLDVLITKREYENNLLKVKLKRNTVDQEELNKPDIINNFEFYKYDENSNMPKNYKHKNNPLPDTDMNIEINNINANLSKNPNKSLQKNTLQEGFNKLKIKK